MLDMQGFDLTQVPADMVRIKCQRCAASWTVSKGWLKTPPPAFELLILAHRASHPLTVPVAHHRTPDTNQAMGMRLAAPTIRQGPAKA